MNNDLLANLQRLGDAEHDDLSVAHDALSEIIELRLLNAELVEVAKKAEQALDILWVSHHANRTDHALELLRSALAKAEGK